MGFGDGALAGDGRRDGQVQSLGEASKFALRGFAEALHMEARPAGVTVTLVFPPDTETPQHAAEAAVRPAATAAIAAAGGLLSADRVAKATLSAARKGRFCVYPGARNRLYGAAMAPFAPLTRKVMGAIAARYDRSDRLRT